MSLGRRLTTPVVLFAAAAVGITLLVPVADTATAASDGKFGRLSLSGAVHTNFALSGACVVFQLPALASSHGAKTLGVTALAAPYGEHETALFTVINENSIGQPSGTVHLMITKDFNAQFAFLNNANHDTSDLWEGGWWRVQAPGEHFAHYGRGTLTMSATGGIGTIDASLEQVNGKRHRLVTVQGSWHCSKISKAS